MNNFLLSSQLMTLPLLVFCWFSLFVGSAQAANSDPTCSLYTIYNGDISVTQSEATINVLKGDVIGLVWNGTNAVAVVDSDGQAVAQLGFKIITPLSDVKYAYTFSQGGKKVTCRINFELVSGSLSVSKKVKSGEKIVLSGQAQGLENITVVIQQSGSVTPVYTKTLLLKNKKFSYKMTKALSDGNYTVVLQTAGVNPVVLATSTLLVGKAASVAATTLVVQKVPLLSGGTVKVGSGVAVAYLQVINVGSNPAMIKSFLFGQVGNAPASIIAGVSITDELGVARGSVGNMVTGTPFIGTGVTVPVVTVLAPKESRLFTVRAVVASTAAGNSGQTISLALLGLGADARISSAFPIYSVSWIVSK